MLSFEIFMVHHVLGVVLGDEVENGKFWEALISEVGELSDHGGWCEEYRERRRKRQLDLGLSRLSLVIFSSVN